MACFPGFVLCPFRTMKYFSSNKHFSCTEGVIVPSHLTHRFTDPCSPLSLAVLKGDTFHTVNKKWINFNFRQREQVKL